MVIFGTGAAGTAGMDETGSEIGIVNVDRNMAQAFEFPKGGRLDTGWRWKVDAIAARLIAEPPAMPSRLPLPVRSGGRIDLPNMGLTTACRKRRPAAAHRSDSRRANPGRLIISA
ncbi:hypothetical protein JQ559_12730 [Bradyrhizobium viridifuturi]|uniref:hypothetical protein n=1 Tax=Bradyrhizobium TaxID=374 RepID=UPI0011B23E75|nr:MULTISPECIES: hypothetical protein [Bradyrhizobium]QRI67064.1 hypothetical protein JQ507_18830 [Bradyrhizobium sp. PSBB068]MBR1019710.1 hypothetical protein [Bradyrhizobium viridifuturi]MBR1037324.1 hypothetical protein [Bradyrhizobium viridifuturi]MBR1044514.1 hypothetical protein [Bradyrhizobium viridifuturi]MBR1074191.1 hypothetical protein [Bradyrhizobium viridifuturi]